MLERILTGTGEPVVRIGFVVAMRALSPTTNTVRFARFNFPRLEHAHLSGSKQASIGKDRKRNSLYLSYLITMPYPIEDKLVIAVSSSALFDMQASDAIFKQEGESAYREYQQNHIDDPLGKGVAFPFVKRLLDLNKSFTKEQPIEVILTKENYLNAQYKIGDQVYLVPDKLNLFQEMNI
ncbi:5'-nucleotidase [Haemophilus sp. HMSC068C11]|uniref:5'-nucleotidase n=1 Tax=Haemophilus sp. HMSC068C11 TaxID=1739522 RepID=UPI0025C687DE|nr:5'-nucleotidase [Haemophilus sp. HMSC068C11]